MKHSFQLNLSILFKILFLSQSRLCFIAIDKSSWVYPEISFLMISTGPFTGYPATAVPQEMDSKIVFPKVSFLLGKTEQSALE